MQTGKHTIFLLILSISIFLPSGCTTNPRPAQVTPQSTYTIKQPGDPLAKRFQDTMPQGATAIESAMELSEKYASLSEQTALLKQQNQDVTSENQKLKEQMLSLENQLKQTIYTHNFRDLKLNLSVVHGDEVIATTKNGESFEKLNKKFKAWIQKMK